MAQEPLTSAAVCIMSGRSLAALRAGAVKHKNSHAHAGTHAHARTHTHTHAHTRARTRAHTHTHELFLQIIQGSVMDIQISPREIYVVEDIIINIIIN